MSTPALSVVPTEHGEPPPPNEAREALRLAIDGHKAVEHQIVTVADAIQRARAGLADTERSIEAATEELDAARERDAKAAAAAIRKGAKPTPKHMKEARARLNELEDNALIEQDAVEQLREQLSDLARELVFAETAIIAARNRLLAPLVDTVSERYLKSSREAMLAAITLSCIRDGLEASPDGLNDCEIIDRLKVDRMLNESKSDIAATMRQGTNPQDYDVVRAEVLAGVREALDNLLTDPDAPLPSTI